MNRHLMVRQITSALLAQDQLVFKYKRDDNDIVVRYVTPIELSDEDVLCAQHLPEEGYRRFKLDNILNFHRVISRHIPSLVTSHTRADAQTAT